MVVDDQHAEHDVHRGGRRRARRAGDRPHEGQEFLTSGRTPAGWAPPGRAASVPAMLTANLPLRFLLELGALAAIAVWGARTGGTTVARVALGAGLPLAVAVLWAAFVGPGAATSAG